jgi:hypothetical protein
LASVDDNKRLRPARRRRTCRVELRMSALRSEADMPRPPAPYQSDATDPKRTLRGLKSRSAAVSWRIVCAIVWVAAQEGSAARPI